MRRPVPLAELLGAPVWLGETWIGTIAGILLDSGGERAIGLEVASAGRTSRFLPWVAARFDAGSVRVESALLLVDQHDTYERLGAITMRDRHALAPLVASADGRVARPERPVSAGLAAGTSVR